MAEIADFGKMSHLEKQTPKICYLQSVIWVNSEGSISQDCIHAIPCGQGRHEIQINVTSSSGANSGTIEA